MIHNNVPGKDMEAREREKFHLEMAEELNQQLRAYKDQLDSIRALTSSIQEQTTHRVLVFYVFSCILVLFLLGAFDILFDINIMRLDDRLD